MQTVDKDKDICICIDKDKNKEEDLAFNACVLLIDI